MAQAAEGKPKDSDSPFSSPTGEARGLYESKSLAQEDLRGVALGPQNGRLDWLDWLFAAAVFAAAMLLYVRTLATTLLLGDSAEYQVLFRTVALAHPTGYPITILLGRLIILLVPVGSFAYRANLVSAICGSLTLALVYLVGRVLSGTSSHIGGTCIVALVGPLALGLSQLFWWHSVIAEMYTPSALMISLVLLLLALWRRSGNPRLLFWAGLAGGLGVGIHYTTPMIAPAVLLYLALTARRKADWGGAVTGALLGLAVTMLAFFTIDALNAPSGYFHAVVEPSVSALDLTPAQYASPLGRIAYELAGRQFQGELLSLPEARVIENVKTYFGTPMGVQANFARLVLGLAVLGGLALLFYKRGEEMRRWPEALLLLFAWAVMLAFIVNYDIGDIYQFYVPNFVPLAIAASVGAAGLLDLVEWIIRKIPTLPWKNGFAAGVTLLAGLALIAGAVQPAVPYLQKSWKAHRITFLDFTDYSSYPYPVDDPEYPYRNAKQIIDQVEDNAIIFTDWSMVYPLYYVGHVEQGRTGISVHETYPAMTPKTFADTAVQYVNDNYGTRPIYFLIFEGTRLSRDYNFVTMDASLNLMRLEKK
jgi:hypothetical protein